jgi:hypothetical protein
VNLCNEAENTLLKRCFLATPTYDWSLVQLYCCATDLFQYFLIKNSLQQ